MIKLIYKVSLILNYISLAELLIDLSFTHLIPSLNTVDGLGLGFGEKPNSQRDGRLDPNLYHAIFGKLVKPHHVFVLFINDKLKVFITSRLTPTGKQSPVVFPHYDSLDQ